MPIASDVELGSDVVIYHPDLVNLYGCVIGEKTSIGPFTEIQRNVRIGARCKISSHSFLCEGLIVEDDVFIGHGVMFINDFEPRAANMGRHTGPTVVKEGASIGTGAVIRGGVTVGTGALIGAGAVVTRDVAENAVVTGVPARLLRTIA
jgi:UDP-2-acetamido-3-amino-2,3-dideoxy-glucuronate N-acetyltransferase